MDDKFNNGREAGKRGTCAGGDGVLGLYQGVSVLTFLFLTGISFALFGTITSVVVAVLDDCLSEIRRIRV